MDITGALATIGQALTIAKSLRELDQSLDAAAYKSQIAELYGNLADIKMALTDARQSLHDKDQLIRVLQSEIDDLKNGEVCPICNQGRLKVISSHPHPHLGVVGVLERTLQCDQPPCKHKEDRIYEPENIKKTKR